MQSKSVSISPLVNIKLKVSDYAQLAKLRLASLVVFSAAIGYFLAVDTFNSIDFFVLMLGGFLVTGASNSINQIIERELDKKMLRTQNRPLAMERMSVLEAIIFSAVIGILGVAMLFYFLNPLSGWLGLLALVLYTALYTPLKQISPISVFVGAVPGAIPPMLGWVAATGEFGLIPGILFAVQFAWQFPHFWAIAWKLNSEYTSAGFKMLPGNKKSKAAAFQILLFTAFTIPVGVLPTVFHITGNISAMVAIVSGMWFTYIAYQLYRTRSDNAATKLMFASFIYLPVVLIAYLMDKL